MKHPQHDILVAIANDRLLVDRIYLDGRAVPASSLFKNPNANYTFASRGNGWYPVIFDSARYVMEYDDGTFYGESGEYDETEMEWVGKKLTVNFKNVQRSEL